VNAYKSADYVNGHYTVAKIDGDVLFEVEGAADPAIATRLVHETFAHLGHAITTAPDVVIRSANGYANAVKILPFRPLLPTYVPSNYEIDPRTDISSMSKTYMLPKFSSKSFANFSAFYRNGDKSIQLFESLGMSKLKENGDHTLHTLKVHGQSFVLQVPKTQNSSTRILWWYDSKHNVTYNLMGDLSDTDLVRIAISLH
jgi:hypothetical protein